MTKLVYMSDSYLKTCKSQVKSIVKKGNHWEIILDQTIFYPQGGGQLSDKGKIVGKNGEFVVTHVRMQDKDVVHEGKLAGNLKIGDNVTGEIDWQLRWENMQLHSSGHVLHEIVKETVPGLIPQKADHGKHPFIEYKGYINPKLKSTLETKIHMLVASGKTITTEMLSYDEIVKRNIPIYGKLPKNKPLRIMTIEDYSPMPDGGTQVANTQELGDISITNIENNHEIARIYYGVEIPLLELKKDLNKSKTAPEIVNATLNLANYKSLILELENTIHKDLDQNKHNLDQLYLKYFGSNGTATNLIKRIKDLPQTDRKSAGMLINSFKNSINNKIEIYKHQTDTQKEFFDVSLPGIPPENGHLHIVTQAIMEITRIFEKIGFTRVRYPEVEWDWYAFTALNMPINHPARDEWETFHIQSQNSRPKDDQPLAEKVKSQNLDNKYSNIVLTPHTSSGQVREMEKGKLPIRMINIAKCYRRQIDISHTPMFHQFEGMYIDKNVSIGHLKGVFDFFVKHFYGSNREIRLRPFHFQFTEPSFEVDINCGICLGTGILPNGQKCRLCKSGWLEMAGTGMIHPVVLKNGGIDPDKYSGFAFGWGVERAYMMKNGIQLDDIRLIYNNDLRFLEQF